MRIVIRMRPSIMLLRCDTNYVLIICTDFWILCRRENMVLICGKLPCSCLFKTHINASAFSTTYNTRNCFSQSAIKCSIIFSYSRFCSANSIIKAGLCFWGYFMSSSCYAFRLSCCDISRIWCVVSNMLQTDYFVLNTATSTNSALSFIVSKDVYQFYESLT